MITKDFLLRVFTALGSEHSRDLWWRCDSEYAPLSLFINCNDVFLWGSADCEDLKPENIEVLEQAYKDSKYHGGMLYVARQRKLRPQGAMYKYIPKKEWPLFNACGPERETGLGNPYKPGEGMK